MASNDIVGLTQFQISAKIEVHEMAQWTPERITAFFTGIANVREATEQESVSVQATQDPLVSVNAALLAACKAALEALGPGSNMAICQQLRAAIAQTQEPRT